MNDLRLLLEQMAGRHDEDEIVGSETVSWKAYRRAEKLADLEIASEVVKIIEETEDALIRKHGYEVLTYLLKNTQQPELAQTLTSLLKSEDKNDEALYSLLMGMLESDFEFGDSIDSVIFYVDDSRELIRNAAIRLLSMFGKNKEVAKNALLKVIENHYDEYDLRYARKSLELLDGKSV